MQVFVSVRYNLIGWNASASEVGALAVERWLFPRSERRPEYATWKAENIGALLTEQKAKGKLAAVRSMGRPPDTD